MLRLEKDSRIRWILGYQFDLNTAAASAVAQDKVATYAALSAASVPVVEHVLVRSVLGEPFPEDELARLFPGAFVIKPLEGTGGRDVQKVSSVSEAKNTILKSGELAWGASPYYDIEAEYRVILLDGKPLIMYEKTQPVAIHGLRFFNLGKGAVPQDIVTEDTRAALESLARQACSALALRLASVDIVRIAGVLRVLEVNDGIMAEYYARSSEQYKQNAALTYDAIVAKMFQ